MMTAMKFLAGTALALSLTAGSATAGGHTDKEKIASLLSAYELGLNGSRIEQIVALYTDDGVFMPQHDEPSVGESAIRTAYDRVFKAIKLDITFTVDEIAKLAPDWAFARTRSKGTVTINATGAKLPEANQELFLLNRSAEGDWKIARYIFSTTNPPRK